MATLADLLAIPREIEYEGKKYQLSEMTLEGQAKYARWLEKRARDDAGRAIDLPPDQQNVYMRNVSRDIAAGVYEWGGAVCLDSLQQPKGMQYAAYLMFLPNHPDITEELARKILESRLKDILETIIQEATSEDVDPKVLEALGILVPNTSNKQSSSLPIRRSAKASKKSRNSRKRK